MPSNSPRHFIELGPSRRVLIEDAIESLILLLDEIDGDAELEGGERELDDAEAGIADSGGFREQRGITL